MINISILDLNCYGMPTSSNRKLRFESIARESLKISPDIMVFQEVWMKGDASILINSLTPSGYKVFPEKFKNISSGGLITFIKNLDVENYKFNKFNYPGPFNFVTAPEWVAGKGFQVFTLNIYGKLVKIINTQLLCDYNRTETIMAAIKGQLAEITKTLSNQDIPIIVAGDINIQPTNSLLIDFKNQLKLRESLPINEITVDLENINRGAIVNIFNKKSYRVDYVFINDKLKNINSQVVFNNPLEIKGTKFHLSDHFGIMSNIDL